MTEPEWVFTDPPEGVDFKSLSEEIGRLSKPSARSYMNWLSTMAPYTYAEFALSEHWPSWVYRGEA
jgi:hypothetical protein